MQSLVGADAWVARDLERGKGLHCLKTDRAAVADIVYNTRDELLNELHDVESSVQELKI